METFFIVLFYLLVAHALCDFSLQTEPMAKGKNRNRPIDLTSIPPGQKPQVVWYHWLTAHAFIHGGAVGIVTGVWWLGVLETIAHWTIDFFKCENKYGINTDQGLHLGCKLLWAIIAVWLL